MTPFNSYWFNFSAVDKMQLQHCLSKWFMNGIFFCLFALLSEEAYTHLAVLFSIKMYFKNFLEKRPTCHIGLQYHNAVISHQKNSCQKIEITSKTIEIALFQDRHSQVTDSYSLNIHDDGGFLKILVRKSINASMTHLVDRCEPVT